LCPSQINKKMFKKNKNKVNYLINREKANVFFLIDIYVELI